MTQDPQPIQRSAGAHAVVEQVHGFVALLRHNGVKVGTAEVVEAFQALEVLGDEGVAQRAWFHGALKATLVKTQADAHTFDRLFVMYFSAQVAVDDRLSGSLWDQLLERMHGEGEVAALMQVLQQMEGGLSQLTQAMLGAQTAALMQMFQQALAQTDMGGLQTRLQLGYFAQRLLSRMGMRGLELDLERIRAAVAERFDAEQTAGVMQALEDRAAALRSSARQTVDEQLRMRDVRGEGVAQLLLDKSFARLSPQELARMQQVVRQLAERLKSVVKRRRVERRGLLDVRRTLRASLGVGGVPVNIRFRRRKKDRPQLVVMCDVSDSVRHASMFMLQLVYTLQELFTRVRSFVFVSDIGEVTDIYRNHPAEQAVDLSLAGQVISLYANSNFGRAFQQFNREHLDAITSRTTVIILGDGRNNYNPSHSALLGQWRRRAHKLIWLCTEDRGTWGFGDSEMLHYARQCDAVEVVQNLRQLRHAVDVMLR